MLRTLIKAPCKKNFRNVFSSSSRILASHSDYSGRASYTRRKYCFDHGKKGFNFNSKNQYFDQTGNGHSLAENKNCSNCNEGEKKGWNITSWVVVVAGILAYLLMNNKANADGEEENKASEGLVNEQTKVVTKENFQAINGRVAKGFNVNKKE